MMLIKTTKVFCILSSILLVNCQTASNENREGLASRFNTRGIEFAKNQLTSIVERTVNSISISDLTGSFFFVSYRVSNFTVNSFSLGQVTLRPEAPRYVVVELKNAQLNLNGSFSVSTFLGSISVSIDVDASQVSLYQRIALGRDSNGNPVVSIADCSAKFGNVLVEFGRSAYSRLLNSIPVSSILSTFTQNANDLICNTLEDLIEQANAFFLQGVGGAIPLPIFDISIDASLVRDPVSTASDLELAFDGRCFPTENSSVTEYIEAPVHPPLTSSTSMFQISLGDYLVNTFLASVEYRGVLNVSINSSTLNSIAALAEASIVFNSKLLAAFNPVVKTLPGVDNNTPFVLKAYSLSTPIVETRLGSLSTIGSFQIRVCFLLANGENIELNLIRLGYNVTVELSARGNVLSWSIRRVDTSVSGSTNAQSIQDQLSRFITTSFLPNFTGSNANQFTLPAFGGFALNITSLLLKENAVELITDIEVAENAVFPDYNEILQLLMN